MDPNQYKSHELKLYTNNNDTVLLLKDSTLHEPGMEANATARTFRFEVNKVGETGGSVDCMMVLPQLHVLNKTNLSVVPVGITLGDHGEHLVLIDTQVAQEVKDRKSADNELSASLTAETKARTDADGVHTASIAQESFDRQAGDQSNLTLINSEVAERKAAVSVLTNATVTNALDIASEVARATAEDIRIDAKLSQQITDSLDADNLLQLNIETEAKSRTDADVKLLTDLTADINAESKRALEKEANLDARIDFIVNNVDTEAIDSLVEIVNHFTENGQSYANRLTYLEGIIASLVSQ